MTETPVSEEDTKRMKVVFDEYVKDMTETPEKALEALVSAGLMKPNGEPEDRYK